MHGEVLLDKYTDCLDSGKYLLAIELGDGEYAHHSLLGTSIGLTRPFKAGRSVISRNRSVVSATVSGHTRIIQNLNNDRACASVCTRPFLSSPSDTWGRGYSNDMLYTYSTHVMDRCADASKSL